MYDAYMVSMGQGEVCDPHIPNPTARSSTVAVWKIGGRAPLVPVAILCAHAMQCESLGYSVQGGHLYLWKLNTFKIACNVRRMINIFSTK